MLILAGAFGTIGLAAMLLMVYLQWRAVTRLVELSAFPARPVIGSYDPDNGVLTVVNFDLGRERTYVNSTWETQEEPFAGDAVNSYNDGPLPDLSQMGPFYELESSSPARPLKKGESLRHRHATFHFEGPATELDRLARALLGVGLEEINSAWRARITRNHPDLVAEMDAAFHDLAEARTKRLNAAREEGLRQHQGG